MTAPGACQDILRRSLLHVEVSCCKACFIQAAGIIVGGTISKEDEGHGGAGRSRIEYCGPKSSCQATKMIGTRYVNVA